MPRQPDPLPLSALSEDDRKPQFGLIRQVATAYRRGPDTADPPAVLDMDRMLAAKAEAGHVQTGVLPTVLRGRS